MIYATNVMNYLNNKMGILTLLLYKKACFTIDKNRKAGLKSH